MSLSSDIGEKVKALFGKKDGDPLTHEESLNVREMACTLYKAERAKQKAEARKTAPFAVLVGSVAASVDRRTESPIEEALFLALNSKSMTIGRVSTQVELGPYRIDLALPDAKLAVECDGRDYHSTPGQIKKDQERDEYIHRLGWTVLRFPGSRIHGDLWGCVDDVMRVYEGLLAIKGKREAWENSHEST